MRRPLIVATFSRSRELDSHADEWGSKNFLLSQNYLVRFGDANTLAT